MKTIRIFISSPGDVGAEREKAREIFDRLQAKFSGVLRISPYFWEHEPMRATLDFTTQIERPSRFDLCICLLWARLGTRLHPSLHRKPDGGEYLSGTEYELLDAVEGWRQSGAPEVYIYKRSTLPLIPLEPEEDHERATAQYRALKKFWERFTEDQKHLVVGFNEYRDLEQFEIRFERDMDDVLKRFVPEGVASSLTLPKSWMKGSPFRGLRHFDFEHAPVFFGRTRAIDQVLAVLKQQAADNRAFVLVFGGSGVGKSSLVRAGVLPWLIKPGVIDGVGLWRRAVMRPSEVNEGDLFDALAAALMRVEGLPEIGSDGTSVSKLAAMLREKPDGVGFLIKGALSQAAREVKLAERLEKQPRALIALAIDQLEELFTVERLGGQREDFLRAVDALARSGYVWVLATLRSDFYARCEESSILMELKKGAGQYHLQPPDEVQLGQMIRLPASAATLFLEENHQTGERLDDLLRDAAVKSPAALPLLEFALEELYEQRDKDKGLLRIEAYRALGGVEGALGKRAEESYQNVSSSAQESFDFVFRQLVTVSPSEGAAAVRHRAHKSAVESTSGARELIASLIADRLLVADRTQEGVVVISVAHEAMLESWPRLAQWVIQHRESLKIRAQVAEAASRWLENDRSDDYLYGRGLPLEKATLAMESNFLSEEECGFVRTSMAKVETQRFQARLASGEGTLEDSMCLRDAFPDAHKAAFIHALSEGVSSMRCNAALLLGEGAIPELSGELVRLVMSDPADDVRRTAAFSLVRLNQTQLFTKVIDKIRSDASSSATIEALSRIRVAADASETPSVFEGLWQKLPLRVRSKTRLHAWHLRLRRGIPILALVLVPALLLSAASAAAFKWLPGIFNYALCQAKPSAAMGVFHGVTAAVIWGGGITLSLVIYRVVFGREFSAKSYLRPVPAVVTGAMMGAISGAALVLLISTVYMGNSLHDMGWVTDSDQKLGAGFGDIVLSRTRFAWPYLITGSFLGIGMALMVNGLRASKKWLQFLIKQTTLTGVRQTWRLISALTKLAVGFAWPIPLALLVAGVLAFFVLRSAPETGRWSQSSTEALSGGRAPEPAQRREWKISPWGEAFGILGDAATQAIGGFFAIVGMGLGIVIIRYGVKVEPRRN